MATELRLGPDEMHGGLFGWGGRLTGGSHPQRPADKQPPGGRGHPSSRPSLPLRHLRVPSKCSARARGSKARDAAASNGIGCNEEALRPGRMTASPPMPLRAFSRGRWICMAREGCVCWGRRGSVEEQATPSKAAWEASRVEGRKARNTCAAGRGPEREVLEAS